MYQDSWKETENRLFADINTLLDDRFGKYPTEIRTEAGSAAMLVCRGRSNEAIQAYRSQQACLRQQAQESKDPCQKAWLNDRLEISIAVSAVLEDGDYHDDVDEQPPWDASNLDLGEPEY